MSLVLPSANVTVQKAGLGVAQGGPTNVHVCVGCSSKGPYKTPTTYSNYDDPTVTYGTGPAVKAAAYAVRATRARFHFIRVPAVAQAASVGTITKPTGKTVSTTGTANWGYDIILVFTVGGEVGVTGMSTKFSLDGGATYSTPAALGTATSVVITGTGITVVLTATETYTADDEIAFLTQPAAQFVQATTVTRADASTSTMTFSGTPEDEYDIRLDALVGGTIGTTGIVIRYSLDGGDSWSAATQLGTGTTFTFMDGLESSGVICTFGAGTLDVGDLAVGKTTGPVSQYSDVQEAIDELRSSQKTWRFIHSVGDATAAKVSSVGGKLTTLAGLGKFTYAVMSARDRVDGEIDATGKPSVAWAERLQAEFVSVVADRVAVSAGRARITCPITGRSNRRPTSWITVARLVEKTIQIDPGRKLDGALSSDVRIFDTNGLLVELDSRIRDALHGARFLTLRTYDDEPGTYITRGNSMAEEGSEFNRIAMRAVCDLGSEIFRQMMTQQMQNNLLGNPLTGVQPGAAGGDDVTPGALAEVDARIIDRELVSALEGVLVANGYVSAVRARVSRTDPFLTNGILTAAVSMTPVGYVDTFNGTIGFESPRLAALLG